ncbi:MAG: serine hydrolase [Flavobacteriaceae bacterium]|nr:serine hydrolase [Flavobacteriaceae bacterium]
MKPLNLLIFFLIITILYSCSPDNNPILNDPIIESFYFPPSNSEEWEMTSPVDIGWNALELDELILFLNNNNTKSFMILHEGKIVVEHYFDNHDMSSLWYWASAGKTLTTVITGIAEREGLVDINNSVSNYLGNGWTSATLDKEQLITCKHLLTMTSGLDDSIGDDVSPNNLHYTADAGTRWAYHNVYVKLQDIIAETSNQSWSNYFNTKLRDKIGMSGIWFQTGDFSVYWSNTRSMARFGLLINANGKWKDEQIIPENYLNDAINTSQELNLAYGYMWWLNGKTSYRLPQTQLEFNGELIPNAPNDMYAALGKNDQKIYIVPSKKLVIVRMGNAADEENFALSSFDNELWSKINQVIN